MTQPRTDTDLRHDAAIGVRFLTYSCHLGEYTSLHAVAREGADLLATIDLLVPAGDADRALDDAIAADLRQTVWTSHTIRQAIATATLLTKEA